MGVVEVIHGTACVLAVFKSSRCAGDELLVSCGILTGQCTMLAGEAVLVPVTPLAMEAAAGSAGVVRPREILGGSCCS